MTDQLNLIDQPGPLDATPGAFHRNDPATSRHAAQAISLRVGALKHRILRHLADAGAYGANDWELHVHCDPNGRVHSAATRRLDLERAGLTRRTGIDRPTDDPSQGGVVSVITDDGVAKLAEVER